MAVLPVLLSIPHGGMRTPGELRSRLAIGREEIFEDIDGFTPQIYDLSGKVRHVVKADIARTFVDLGRAPTDLPPDNPDGVIKSHTCFGKTIFKTGQEPTVEETASLLERYYFPFHNRLQKTILQDQASLVLCIDCHSMAETGPRIAPDTGKKRPLFCLGTRFGASVSDEMAGRLKTCIAEAFEIDGENVAVDKPFAGGYITRHYGNNPVPWIQIEMNRCLYMRKPWFDRGSLKVASDRIRELNSSFGRALEAFFA